MTWTAADLPDPRMRGRTRKQVEHDVLVAMLHINPHRVRARHTLRPTDFSTSTHRALWDTTAEFVRWDDVPALVARAIGCNIDQAEQWVLMASMQSYESDVELLIEWRQ